MTPPASYLNSVPRFDVKGFDYGASGTSSGLQKTQIYPTVHPNPCVSTSVSRDQKGPVPPKFFLFLVGDGKEVWATPSAQGLLLLALHSKISPGRLGWRSNLGWSLVSPWGQERVHWPCMRLILILCPAPPSTERNGPPPKYNDYHS